MSNGQGQFAQARTIARQAGRLAARCVGMKPSQGGQSQTVLAVAAHLLARMDHALGPGDAEADHGGGRVLLADDVAMNREIATLYLETAGYEVACAEEGGAAARMAAGADFLVVLMDVRMPGTDGLEATRRIRAAGGSRGAVPIVALTAQIFDEQIALCREAGMDTQVAKPFTLESLLDAVARGVRAGDLRRSQVGAGRMAPVVAPPASVMPQIGAKLPILDIGTLNRTVALLTPEAVASYLDTLAEKAEALQEGLSRCGSVACSADALAEAAHALAGSAGLFGFERLVTTARIFERTVRIDPAKAASLADDLDAVLEASLGAMRSTAHQSASPHQIRPV